MSGNVFFTTHKRGPRAVRESGKSKPVYLLSIVMATSLSAGFMQSAAAADKCSMNQGASGGVGVPVVGGTDQNFCIGGYDFQGNDAKVTDTAGIQNTAIGINAIISSGNRSVALGQNATVEGSGTEAVALGVNAVVRGAYSSAVGNWTLVRGDNSVALGYKSDDDARNNVVSVGNALSHRQIIWVANGTEATDATNVSQLQGLITGMGGTGGGVDAATGVTSAPTFTVGAQNGLTLQQALQAAAGASNGSDFVVDISNSTIYSSGATANRGVGASAMAIGVDAVADSTQGGTRAGMGDTMAIGQSAKATGIDSVAIGGQAKVSGTNSLMVGGNYAEEMTGNNSTALGINASTISANNATAVGFGANTTANASVAVGNAASARADNSVALGNGSIATQANTVSIGAAGRERRVTNVAEGINGTDAVNVNQLNALATTTEGRIDGLDERVTGLDESIAERIGASEGKVTERITELDSSVTERISTLDSSVTERLNTISNDFDDRFSAMESSINDRFSNVDRRMTKLDNKLSAGIASAIAVASLPQAYQPGKSSAAIGVGNYHGEQGFAIGISTISESGRYILKFNGSGNTRGDAAVGAGAAIVW